MLSKLNKEFLELYMKLEEKDANFFSNDPTEEEEEVYLEGTSDDRIHMQDLAVQVALEFNRIIKEAADDIPDYFKTVEDCE